MVPTATDAASIALARAKVYVLVATVVVTSLGPTIAGELLKAQLPSWAHLASGLVAVFSAIRLAYYPGLADLSVLPVGGPVPGKLHSPLEEKLPPPTPPAARGFIDTRIVGAVTLAMSLGALSYGLGCALFASHGAQIATSTAKIVACVFDEEAKGLAPAKIATDCGLQTAEEVLQLYQTFDKRTMAKYPTCAGVKP